MKVSFIFMLAVSLTLGAATEVSSNDASTELATRDLEYPDEGRYLAKRVIKLFRRKSKGSFSDALGDPCFIGLKAGVCDGLGTCKAGDKTKKTLFCA
ncbi:hypothetical protein PspLS_11768 [Pyricularia sp. CBS 133598]|nr:hypothetical protein PspLS_11768 [Pyricularia sp. CBS 133598]